MSSSRDEILDADDYIYTEDIERLIGERDAALEAMGRLRGSLGASLIRVAKERDDARAQRDKAEAQRDELARAISVRTKERDAAVSSAKRLQAIVTSEALERYPQR